MTFRKGWLRQAAKAKKWRNWIRRTWERLRGNFSDWQGVELKRIPRFNFAETEKTMILERLLRFIFAKTGKAPNLKRLFRFNLA